MKAYIARDDNMRHSLNDYKGQCWVYLFTKPHKMPDGKGWNEKAFAWDKEQDNYNDYIDCFMIDDKDLPEGVDPKWEDDEPVEVEMIFRPITH